MRFYPIDAAVLKPTMFERRRKITSIGRDVINVLRFQLDEYCQHSSSFKMFENDKTLGKVAKQSCQSWEKRAAMTLGFIGETEAWMKRSIELCNRELIGTCVVDDIDEVDKNKMRDIVKPDNAEIYDLCRGRTTCFIDVVSYSKGSAKYKRLETIRPSVKVFKLDFTDIAPDGTPNIEEITDLPDDLTWKVDMPIMQPYPLKFAR